MDNFFVCASDKKYRKTTKTIFDETEQSKQIVSYYLNITETKQCEGENRTYTIPQILHQIHIAVVITIFCFVQ